MVTFLLSDIDAPVSQGAHGNEVMDQLKVDTLLSFGFQEEIARKALKASVKILNITVCSFLHRIAFGHCCCIKYCKKVQQFHNFFF
jgi:hypothetical protein